jgi:hypothetical protein
LFCSNGKVCSKNHSSGRKARYCPEIIPDHLLDDIPEIVIPTKTLAAQLYTMLASGKRKNSDAKFRRLGFAQTYLWFMDK